MFNRSLKGQNQQCIIPSFTTFAVPSKPIHFPHYIFCYSDLLCVSDHRCHTGWTGNRCHVKKKPSLTTSTTKPENAELGNEDRPHLSLVIKSLQALLKRMHVLPPRLDGVYAGIAIGLLLLVSSVSVCVLALCKKKCYLM